MAKEAHPLVLVVEDDPAIAALLRDIFTEYGFRTLIAVNANRAMQQLETARPAALTLDLDLPGISGVTLLRLIHAQWPAAALQIVVITAQPAFDPIVHEYAQAVMAKPFDLEALVATVAALCEAAPILDARAVGSAPRRPARAARASSAASRGRPGV